MSKPVEPQIFVIAATRVEDQGLADFLKHIGFPTWKSDAPSDAERLTEVMGKMCYDSWDVSANPNLTMVRSHNDAYIRNILDKGDGSVLEHAWVSFMFCDVSRVFTHELVRHRVGTAISQQSLRFVRLTDINWYAPAVVRETPEVMEIYARTVEELSQLQRELAEMFNLDKDNKRGLTFDQKKKLTSTMRRLAPEGLATRIGWSCDMRTLRHVIEQRTAPWAEEEIRLVFGKVGMLAKERWPNLFADYEVSTVDGLPYFQTKYRKV